MQSIRQLRRFIALALIAAIISTGLFAQTAAAGIVGTDSVVGEQTTSEQERLKALIDRDDIQEQLTARGVDPADAAERAASMSDAEAAEVMAQIDELPAGGAGVVTLLLVIILLLLILR